MKLRSRKIILVDQTKLNGLDEFGDHFHEVYVLDPVQLFSQIDWTQFDEDARVINQIYSALFDEVVINKKKLVCFWPLVEQFGNDWFELTSLVAQNKFELEVHKEILLHDTTYGLNPRILNAWKKFVFFMIESLLEDIRLNEKIEEIATLTGEGESIILFKMEHNGSLGYSFASSSHQYGFLLGQDAELGEGDSVLPFFDSFDEMLNRLLDENDLSRFQTKFRDSYLEKTFFSMLAKDFKTKNLIQQWLESYSLN